MNRDHHSLMEHLWQIFNRGPYFGCNFFITEFGIIIIQMNIIDCAQYRKRHPVIRTEIWALFFGIRTKYKGQQINTQIFQVNISEASLSLIFTKQLRNTAEYSNCSAIFRCMTKGSFNTNSSSDIWYFSGNSAEDIFWVRYSARFSL